MRILKAVFIALLAFNIGCSSSTRSVQKAPSTQSNSPVVKSYPKAKIQANQLNDAVLARDYEKAADLTCQKFIEMIGGRTEYLDTLKADMNELQSQDFRIVSTVSDDPTQIIEVGSDVYAILPTTVRIKVPEGILVGQSSLIGMSNDRGEHWTFVDSGRGFSQEQLKTLFPTVADQFKIPQEKRPVLERAP